MDVWTLLSHNSSPCCVRACVCSFQVGQIALFMCDQYGNYLALGADSKTYYLDSECAHGLQDLAARMAALRFKGYVSMGSCLCAQPSCVHFQEDPGW